MRSLPRTTQQQLRLIPGDLGPDTPPPAPRRRDRRQGRNAAMAERLDRVAQAAEREAMEAVLAGSDALAREALDRAAAARKAARILRAGPGGVRDLMAS